MNHVHALLRSEYAYRRGIFGKDIGVAVLDTGVYAAHPDLQSHILEFKDFVNGRRSAYDDSGHGTHVCGIIGGSGKASEGLCMGIAPLSKLICLKVLDKEGNGSTAQVLSACRWILNNRHKYNIKIVNISVGTIALNERTENDVLVRAVNELWDDGIVVVAAAGNNGPGKGTVTIPGISRKIITVGTLEDGECETDRKRHFLYSGRGPTRECVLKPEVIAPGSNILSCANHDNAYVRKSGTSMAAPVVSGSIALLMEAYPLLNNKDIKLRLYDRAVDTGLPRERQGWGFVQINRLLEPDMV